MPPVKPIHLGVLSIALGALAWFLARPAAAPPSATAGAPAATSAATSAATTAAQPTSLPALGERHISAQAAYALGLGPDRQLRGWGRGLHAVLEPQAANWRYIAAAISTSYAITNDGQLLRRAAPAWLAPDGSPAPHRRVFPDIAWTKVGVIGGESRVRDNAFGIAMGLSADGALYVWREQELDDGAVCLYDTMIACIPITAGERLRHRTDAELDAAGLPVARQIEADLQHYERMYPQRWAHQPGGVDSPEAKKDLREMEKMLATMRSGRTSGERAKRQREVDARSIAFPIPLSPAKNWSDFCLAFPKDSERDWGYALDRSGTLWRVDLDARSPAFHHQPKVYLHAVRPAAKFARVFCSGLSPTLLALDTEQHLWQATRAQTGLDPALAQVSQRRWNSVAPGDGFVIGIADDGTLWAWGEQYAARLLGSAGADAGPRRLSDKTDWVDIDAGPDYALARDRQGRLYAWGSNALELRADGPRDTPAPLR